MTATLVKTNGPAAPRQFSSTLRAEQRPQQAEEPQPSLLPEEYRAAMLSNILLSEERHGKPYRSGFVK